MTKEKPNAERETSITPPADLRRSDEDAATRPLTAAVKEESIKEEVSEELLTQTEQPEETSVQSAHKDNDQQRQAAAPPSSSQIATVGAQKSTDHKDANPQQKPGVNWDAISSISGIAGLVGLVFTLVLMYQSNSYTRSALALTTESNNYTRAAVALTRQSNEMARELERAHVVIQDIGPLPLVNNQRVPITIKNIGRAAATGVQVWVVHNSQGEAPLSKDTGLQCVWMTNQMVTNALGADQATTYYTPGIEVLKSTAEQMRSGKGRLFLWISLNYTDILGTKPGAPACYAWTGDPLGNWRPCDIHDYRDRIDPKNAVCK